MFSHWARDYIRIASVDSAVKWVPGGDNLVKGVQCYEHFGGIALKNHAFSFFFHISFYRRANWITNGQIYATQSKRYGNNTRVGLKDTHTGIPIHMFIVIMWSILPTYKASYVKLVCIKWQFFHSMDIRSMEWKNCHFVIQAIRCNYVIANYLCYEVFYVQWNS